MTARSPFSATLAAAVQDAQPMDTGAPERVVHPITPAASWPELAQEALHGLAGEIVSAIAPHTEADPAAVLFQTLVDTGNLIGRNAHFRAEADRHYSNLFLVLVGDTAKGRKGSSEGQVRQVVKPVDADWATGRIVNGLSSGEGLIWAVRDRIEKQQPVREKRRVIDYETVIEDHGESDKRLLVIEPEFASVLKMVVREGNTLSPVIRAAWDSGDLRIMTKNSPAKATGAHISIIGHITRDELLRHLDSTEAANGFANRFLWCAVRRSKLLPEGGQFHRVDVAPLVRAISEVVEFARTVGEMKRDDAARELWKEVYTDLSEGQPRLLGSVLARAEAQVMRLACLYALLDCTEMVRVEHLTAALAAWEYCEASARYIFGDALGDPIADALLQALRNAPDGLTRTELSTCLGRNQPAGRIKRALEMLQERRLALCTMNPTDGRPAERWCAVK